eukprot:522712_1
MTDETTELMNEIDKLKQLSEKSQLIINVQENQLQQNRDEINEFEKKLIDKNKIISNNENELKNMKLKVDEFDTIISNKNDEICVKNEEIENLKHELENRTQKLTEENHKLAQQIEEFQKMTGDIDINNGYSTNETSVEQIIKTATLTLNNEENEEKDAVISTAASVLDNMAYLQKLETERLVKRTTIIENENDNDDKKQKRNRFYSFKKYYDGNNLLNEKTNIEKNIKEKKEKLISLKKISLPNDGNKRMNILIDIAILEDDIIGLKRKLKNINKKIMKKNKKKKKKNKKFEDIDETDEEVAMYQEAVYGNKQPMMKLKYNKSMENSNNNEMISKVTTMSELDQNMDVSIAFSETLYPDIFDHEEKDENDKQLLDELKTKLKNGIEIKDRRYNFKTYPKCFIGKDVVTYMFKNKICKSREEGVILGKMLLSANIIKHVTNDHDFKDDKYFYRFLSDEPGPKYVEI